jgi:hypothetical protein
VVTFDDGGNATLHWYLVDSSTVVSASSRSPVCAAPVSGTTGFQPVSGRTGFQPVSGRTGFQPVSSRTGFQPVSAGAGFQPGGVDFQSANFVALEKNGDPTIGSDTTPDVPASGESSETPADQRDFVHRMDPSISWLRRPRCGAGWRMRLPQTWGECGAYPNWQGISCAHGNPREGVLL